MAEIMSLPIRGAWIEIQDCGEEEPPWLSLPIRGAWIEICYVVRGHIGIAVAPHPGSVD